MGCKNAKDKAHLNPFDIDACRGRSESKRGATPRSGSRTPRSNAATPRNRDHSTTRSKSPAGGDRSTTPPPVGHFMQPMEVTEVPLVLSRFESLPPGAIKRTVFRVYDGDTITLRGDDNAKVRLLAMDTPEVQDNEPYSLEARDFLANLILDKIVFLAFEGQEKDRYGRYLAYVFVKDKTVPPFKYICANLALVESGLGNYYHPQTTPLVMDDLFVEAQKSARFMKINTWRDVCEDYIVYLTPHGKAFHTKDCASIAHVPLTSVTMGEALDDGHYACRDCHPNWASAKSKTEAANSTAGAATSKAAAAGATLNGITAAVVKRPISCEDLAARDVPANVEERKKSIHADDDVKANTAPSEGVEESSSMVKNTEEPPHTPPPSKVDWEHQRRQAEMGSDGDDPSTAVTDQMTASTSIPSDAV